MIPFQHISGFGSGQHLGHLVQAKVNPTLLANAVNAGQEFLGDQRAIVGIPAGEGNYRKRRSWALRRFRQNNSVALAGGIEHFRHNG